MNAKKLARLRTKKHIRKRVFGTPDRPRLVVYKSLKHIYAQLIDDTNQRTITGISSLSPNLKEEISQAKNKVQVAEIVGTGIAKIARDMKLEEVVFDRNGNIYHGRIKAVAEGARKGGLLF